MLDGEGTTLELDTTINPNEAGGDAGSGGEPKGNESAGDNKPELGEDGKPVIKPADKGDDADDSDPLLSFQKEAGLAPGTNKAGNAGDGKPGQLTPEVEREVQRRINAGSDKARRESQQAGVKRDFDERLPALREYLAEVHKMPHSEVEKIAEQFTIHHGQASEVARTEERNELSAQYRDAMVNAAKQHVPEIATREGGFSSTEEFVEAVVEGSRTGYVAETEVNARINKALKDFHAYLVGKGLTQGTKEVAGAGGGSTAASKKADDVLDDPNATAEERAAAFEKKHGFKPNQ